MTATVELAIAAVIFLIGLRLSFFFSGSETGFYRVSFLRVSMDAREGDRTARRMLWFVQNPGYFVATTLVGNNLANYLVTVAIGVATAAVIASESGWVDVLSTLLIAPIVFIFGEMLPKNLYYRAPNAQLRRGINWFTGFFWTFLPVSFPLIWLSTVFERWGDPGERPLGLVLGRSRLAQVLGQGRHEGLLTDSQARLVDGLLQTAPQPVMNSAIPANRVLGVDEKTSREEILAFARRYALASVPVRRQGTTDHWFAYVRVADLAVTRVPAGSLRRNLPRISAGSSKLEAIAALREAGAPLGAVYQGERLVGLINEHGLVEQLFRTPQTVGTRVPVGAG